MGATKLAPVKSEAGIPRNLRITRLTRLFMQPSLRIKLLSLVVVISLFSIFISNFLIFSYQRKQIIQNVQTNINALGNAIESNLLHAMTTNNWGMVDDIVQAIGAEGDIDSIRLINTRGIVRADSLANEIGIQLDPSQPACMLCHAGRSPTKTSAIFSYGSGHQTLINVTVLQNGLECQGCHGVANKVLGTIMIETPLTSLNQQLTTGFWRTTFFSIAAVALLVTLMSVVLRRYVLNPIHALSEGMAEISSGNLDYQVTVTSQDELGSLGQSFNLMRKQLNDLNVEMQHRNQELSVLNEVAHTVNQTLELQSILDTALETIGEKLGIESSFLFLYGETGGLTLRTSRGASEAQLREIEIRQQKPELDISNCVTNTGQPYFVPNMASDHRFVGLWDELENRSYVNVLLRSKGKVLGTLGLTSQVGKPITSNMLAVIEALGNEIGIAVDHALILADSQRKAKEAITLFQLGMMVSKKLALKEVLINVAKAAQELLEADIGLVGLIDEEQQEVIIRAVAGTQVDALRGIRISVHKEAPGNCLVSGKPIMDEVNDQGQQFIHDREVITKEHIASYLAVPLKRGEDFLGVVEVMTRQPRRFLPRDAQLLTSLAHHIVVAIENAQLYRQLHYLATLEERDRLAREMHDQLAQALGYINVKASITQDLLTSGQIDQARESFSELKSVAKFIYTDVREAIFKLRTPVTKSDGLLTTLQDYLVEYRTHYGADIHLIVENEDSHEILQEISSQIFWIIQEALTNIRKHASARNVLIRYNQVPTQVRISIEDDGQGFDPQLAALDGHQHFGLQIMHERAMTIGGKLDIDSQLGRGTRLVIQAPLTVDES